MNKKEYWNFFYKTQVNKINLNHPSQFATFIVGETENITSLLEFGCGNGRDALFFAHYFKKVYAFDGSNEIINKNKKGGLQYHHKKNECGYILKGKLKIKFDNLYIFESLNECSYSKAICTNYKVNKNININKKFTYYIISEI